MIAAGVDVSTKSIEVVVLSQDGPRRYFFKMKGKLLIDRVPQIADLWRKTFLEAQWISQVEVWGVERPFGKFGAWQTSMALGAVMACIGDANIAMLSPPEWRKWCGIRGSAAKGNVRAWVAERVDCDDWTQDAVDAFCIGYGAREFVKSLDE